MIAAAESPDHGGQRRAARPAEVARARESAAGAGLSWRGGRGRGTTIPWASSARPLTSAGRETDVLIGIGCRLELQCFRWPNPTPGLETIHIDIDPDRDAAHQTVAASVADRAGRDPRAHRRPAARRGGTAASHRGIRAVKAATALEFQKVQPHMDYLAAIRDVLPRDGFFVEEICQIGFTSRFGFPVYEPRSS